jgi:hypothetical protein
MTQLIALIDDRADQRSTLRGHIEHVLPQGWKVLDRAPHKLLADAVKWVLSEKVTVLLLDERLDEDAGAGSSYTGHELALELRKYANELPIFVITSWSGDPDLTSAEAALDNIVSRSEFGRQAETHVARFVRAGQRFADTHSAQLAELSSLATAIAAGTASKEERRRAAALQSALDLSAAFDPFSLQADALRELEALAKSAEALLGDLGTSGKKQKKPARKPRPKKAGS